MAVQEYRIGNYLNIHGGNDVTFCKKAQPRFLGIVTWLERSGSISYENVDDMPRYYHVSSEPIPITEEWLLKFGFEEIDLNVFRLHDVLSHGRITFYLNHGMMCELGQVRGYKLGEPDIKYVHQLQNLYFALTGEELTIHNLQPTTDN